MLTLLWLFYFVDGCTVYICLFVIYAQNYLILGEGKNFLRAILAFLIYALVGVVFCYLVRRPMADFMVRLACEHEEIDLGTDRPTLPTAALDTKPKEKKPIEIPEFLFKYSSTFFKTATKKDLLFKKLFNPEKVPKKEKAVSDRFRSKEEPTKMPQQTGKMLKKTDLSMINFHLNLQDNDQLMKHYQ